jgi:hypothetical protein
MWELCPVVGFLGVPAAGVISGVSHLFAKGSPRFEGGPLVSTVNDTLRKIASGDLAALQSLWGTANNPSEKHRRQWRDVWDQLVPQQPLTDAQRRFIVSVDPSKQSVALGGSAFQGATGTTSALQQVTEPARAAVEQAVAGVREGLAQTVERAGVGGAAVGARALRGRPGVIDRVAELVRRPWGVVVAVGVVGVVVAVVALATRRRSA